MAPGTYSSPLRTEQAAQTRQRVLEAAAELFATDGFARTTLVRIARAAGVSVETVQAQGSKRSLLSAAVHWRTFGLPDEQRFLSTSNARELLEEPTAAGFCRRGAELVTGFNSRTFRIWRAFVSAAADDPAVDQELSDLSRFIYTQCRDIVGALATRHSLRPDRSHEELADALWVLVGSETYDRLTARLGWSSERYETWLARSLHDLLFCGAQPIRSST